MADIEDSLKKAPETGKGQGSSQKCGCKWEARWFLIKTIGEPSSINASTCRCSDEEGLSIAQCQTRCSMKKGMVLLTKSLESWNRSPSLPNNMLCWLVGVLTDVIGQVVIPIMATTGSGGGTAMGSGGTIIFTEATGKDISSAGTGRGAKPSPLWVLLTEFMLCSIYSVQPVNDTKHFCSVNIDPWAWLLW